MRGICHRVALVLDAGSVGAAFIIDSRGRILVPAWLRTRTAAAVVVGTRGDPALVVIAPTTALDALGDLLSGAHR